MLMASTCGLLALAACKGDPDRPPVANGGSAYPGSSSGSGGTSDAGSNPSPTTDGGDAGACTDLLPSMSGGVILQDVVIDALPAGSGGTLADGLYFLSQAQLYQSSGIAGPTDTEFVGVMRITGTTFERAVSAQAGTATEATSAVSGTITTSGTNATIALSCPSASQETVRFTALDTTLTFSNPVTGEQFVYTKQQ